MFERGDLLLGERRAELHVLCRRYRVRRLDLFGSAATGGYRPESSDLDFLVEFDPPAPGSYADAYFGLLEGLEQLFGRPVDLVVASAIKNPYFRESVEKTRALLYAA
ncbi:MAG: nucleotidyltransferase domain-containing protein [Rhodospirillales bacterium]|nr:nucleotidyltransferase domain-containing protein [Rhodospirillales bacterium]